MRKETGNHFYLPRENLKQSWIKLESGTCEVCSKQEKQTMSSKKWKKNEIDILEAIEVRRMDDYHISFLDNDDRNIRSSGVGP